MPLFLHQFPNTRFHADVRLMTWHPQGVLDDELVDRILQFIEAEEHSSVEPLHRYTDLNGLSEIRLRFGHASQIAERRRTTYSGPGGVKSAFCCEWIYGFSIAKMYEALMADGPIKVRAFRSRQNAAAWLDVPAQILEPPPAGQFPPEGSPFS